MRARTRTQRSTIKYILREARSQRNGVDNHHERRLQIQMENYDRPDATDCDNDGVRTIDRQVNSWMGRRAVDASRLTADVRQRRTSTIKVTTIKTSGNLPTNRPIDQQTQLTFQPNSSVAVVFTQTIDGAHLYSLMKK